MQISFTASSCLIKKNSIRNDPADKKTLLSINDLTLLDVPENLILLIATDHYFTRYIAMDEEEKLLQLMEIYHNNLDSFQNALSESEKQFTWWILAILGFIVIGFNVQYVQRPVLLLILSLAGIIVSLAGYFVIRKEGRYFARNKETFNRIANVLDINEELWNVSGVNTEDEAKKETLAPDKTAAKKSQRTWVQEETGNKPVMALMYFSVLRMYSSLIRIAFSIGLIKKEKAETLVHESSLNIRDCFQVVYLLFAVVFLLLIGTY
ncbi:MAG: hypothetical protein M0Q91_01015 [Methanoregula sp.]|nr:hypothetical protein [Methanoregula sp.]